MADAAVGDAADGAVAVADAPDVVDTDPADAGPVTYPLDPPPSATEVRALLMRGR